MRERSVIAVLIVPSLRPVDEQHYAYRSYRDAPAALRRLEAIGFSLVRRQDGTRRARVLDPESGEWSIGTYGPGLDG